MNGDGLYPGIGIGLILGAGAMLLILSLVIAASDRAEERQLRKMRERGW